MLARRFVIVADGTAMARGVLNREMTKLLLHRLDVPAVQEDNVGDKC